jgi:hypothetical protein
MMVCIFITRAVAGNLGCRLAQAEHGLAKTQAQNRARRINN